MTNNEEWSTTSCFASSFFFSLRPNRLWLSVLRSQLTHKIDHKVYSAQFKQFLLPNRLNKQMNPRACMWKIAPYVFRLRNWSPKSGGAPFCGPQNSPISFFLRPTMDSQCRPVLVHCERESTTPTARLSSDFNLFYPSKYWSGWIYWVCHNCIWILFNALEGKNRWIALKQLHNQQQYPKEDLLSEHSSFEPIKHIFFLWWWLKRRIPYLWIGLNWAKRATNESNNREKRILPSNGVVVVVEAVVMSKINFLLPPIDKVLTSRYSVVNSQETRSFASTTVILNGFKGISSHLQAVLLPMLLPSHGDSWSRDKKSMNVWNAVKEAIGLSLCKSSITTNRSLAQVRQTTPILLHLS